MSSMSSVFLMSLDTGVENGCPTLRLKRSGSHGWVEIHGTRPMFSDRVDNWDASADGLMDFLENRCLKAHVCMLFAGDEVVVHEDHPTYQKLVDFWQGNQ